MLRRSVSSKPLKCDSSFKSMSSGMELVLRLTNMRSMSTLAHFNLMMGVCASGTGVSSFGTSEDFFLSKSGNNSKKSSLVTCFGATRRVSMSEPESKGQWFISSRNHVLTWAKDAKLVAAKGEDLSSSVIDGRL